MLKQPKKYYRGVWGKGRDRRKNPAIKDWIIENKKNGRGERIRTSDFCVPNATL